MKRVALVVLLVVGGCAQDPSQVGGGGSDAGDPGTGVGDMDTGPTCTPPQVARYGVCIDPPASCGTDDDCENDSYCDNMECIPYGVGPRGDHDNACLRTPVIGLFAPKAKCSWTQPEAGDPYPTHVNVLSTPLTADFDFDNDPKTSHPSIVFVSYNCNDGACGAQPGCYGVIRVLDGHDCHTQYSIAGSGLIIGSVTPAIGDIDGDGRPDIVAEHQGGGVMGFKFDAAQNKFVEMWTNYSSFNSTGCHWDSVALHDLDDDGVPEIVTNGPFPAAFDNKGQLIDGATTNTSYSALLHPVAGDLDNDGAVELIDGKEAFRFDKATRKWTAAANFGGSSLGQVAYADFGTYGANPAADQRGVLDGVPEIVVVASGTVRVQTLAGRVVFGPLTLPGTTAGAGGAPTVGDFDGDGRVEFGTAGATAYTVFDPDCVPGAAAFYCPSQSTNGVLWYKVSQDLSSNVTGSSVFDFDGDGKDEVVYADECFSRVYDGRSGDVLFSQYHTSCTWYENPIVADTDGDFRADVVIPSNANCNVSCPALDPIHDGVRCDTNADCPGTTTCARENAGDKYGRCRCAAAADCGDPGLTCTDPIAGPSAVGKVCRAQHPQGVAQTGILVMHDALDRWVSSRTIWNQHAYSVSNVNDDGTIPKTSKWTGNWKMPKLNNYRMNVQGALDPANAPDLTSRPNAMPGQSTHLLCSGGALKLEAKVCNRGTNPVAAGEPVSFYQGVPPSGPALCSTTTSKTLQPGDCDTVSCDWPNAPTSPTDVSVVADDDGTGKGVSTECKEKNNRGTLLGVYCDTVM
jgi:hypothetical protein